MTAQTRNGGSVTFARLCIHGEIRSHVYFMDVPIPHDCPGGVVLDPEEAERRIAEVLDAWAPDLNDYAVEKFTAEVLDALAAAQTREVTA